MDSQALLQTALDKNVAFVPGNDFFAHKADGRRYCRLNFSNASPDRIREGIQRLASLVNANLAVPEPAG